MGWDDVRVHLLADGARLTKVPIPGTSNLRGRRGTAGPHRSTAREGPPSFERAKACLEGCHFDFVERRRQFAEFTRGPIRASVSMPDEQTEKVIEVELEFRCSPSSGECLEEWSSLADSVAHELGLSVMDWGSLIAFDGARQAIVSSQTWQEFGDRYGWKSI